MSADVKNVLVRDDRLNCTDRLSYAVMQGAQSVNPAVFQAVSASTSSHVYNINVPSEQTIIDRRVLWRSTVILKIDGTAPAGQFLINYGLTDALAPFPLHQLVNVLQATINNNSTSINLRDVLPSLIRFTDRRELARYNGTTPTAFDTYYQYPDGVGAMNNSLGAWGNVADNDLVPRGAWSLDYVGTNADGSTPAALPVSTGAAQTVYVKFTVAEPLMISPLIFANPQSNSQGMYGVQNMTFQMSIGDASRVWRTASSFAKTVAIQSFSNSQLLFTFLSPNPALLLSARNVVPYQEFPRYITSFNNISLASQAVNTFRSSTLQLNVIPDKLIMFVRERMGALTSADADCFLSLSGDNPLNISFNNVSGILSSATIYDLYRMSIEAGSNQNFYEFAGFANMNNILTGTGRKIPTSGSMVVLEFGKDIPLQEAYYAPGSLGSFSLQVNLNCVNQSSATITDLELVLITMNSGAFVLERGSASVFTGLLTKSDVLSVAQQEPYYASDVRRMVGGGFFDSLKSIIGKILPVLAPLAKDFLSKQGPIGNVASKVIGALGYGSSGGGSSGGGVSGGRNKLMERMM